jgi:hypothetical protein
MGVQAVSQVDLSPDLARGVSAADLAGKGIANLVRCGGMTVGYSVRATKSAGAMLKGIGLKSATALRRPGRALAEALRIPTAEVVPPRIAIGTRLRARKRIRRLRKEISRLQKRAGKRIASVMALGAAQPLEDEQVQEQTRAMRRKKAELAELLKPQPKPEAVRDVPVVSKPLARDVRIPAVVERSVARQEPEPSVRVEKPAKPLVREAVIKPVASKAAMAPVAPPRKIEPEVAQAPEKRRACGRDSQPAASMEGILEQAEFSLLSQRLAFKVAFEDAQSAEAGVRERAARALRSIENPAATRVLALLAKDSDLGVRVQSLAALQEREHKPSLPLFVEALADESVRVRATALRGLYKVAPAQGIPHFVKALADEDAGVRRRAAMCLAWVEAREAIPELIPLLDDADARVRRAAIESLQGLGSKVSVPRLIEMLSREEDVEVLDTVVEALRTLTGKRIVFNPEASEQTRAQGKSRWETWWKESKTSFLASH